MTFLNQMLAWGAVAFAIPLIIHILNRSRFRTVEWGAMHLLESVIKVNHKRFRIDQLILLLVRCAIPVLLAVCLARPVLTGARMLEGDTPVSLVILLDTSYSMDATSPAGSRFNDAVDAACRIVATASRGSQVAVIQTGGRPVPLFDQPIFDPEAVIRRIRQLKAGYGASDMPAAFDEAISTLSGMSHARRELIVISDFQPADWQSLTTDAGDAIRRQLDAMEIKPELTLLAVGESITGNISVDGIEFPRRAIGVDQQISVRAAIRNHGTDAKDSVRVILKIDGVEHSVTQTTLVANGSTQTLFTCSFDSPGSHVIEVEVVADDSLQHDNRFAAAVSVWDAIRVLLVDGDPSAQALQSETDYLSIALTPFTFGRVRLSDLVQTQTIQIRQFSESTLQDARVVVLANVSKLDDSQLATLTTYVQNGGALLICAGNRIDINWYRDRLYASGKGLLPMAFGALQGFTDSSDTSRTSSVDEVPKASHIVSQRFNHPSFELFNDPANGDLSTAEIRRWYGMSMGNPASEDGNQTMAAVPAETGSGTESDMKAASILLRLDTGDALLAERQFGDGVVVQIATSIDADWSDLPVRPFYVPLMQQLITTMASRISPPRNINTGDPAVVLYRSADVAPSQIAAPESAQDSIAKLSATGKSVEGNRSDTISVITPDGSRQTIQGVEQGKLMMGRFEATGRPGIYVMTPPSAETLHFVAETSRTESDLSVLDEARLKLLTDRLKASHITSPEQYQEKDRLRRNGREIWKYVLAAVLVFMALELVLQQRFARVHA